MSEIYNGTFTLGNTSACTIVAGPGVKVDDSVPGTIRIGTDETVLYSGANNLSTSSYNLTESYMNFERMRITFVYNDGYSICREYDTKYDSTHIPAPMGITQTTGGTTYCKIGGFTHNAAYTIISRTTAYDITNFTGKNAANVITITKVEGINRISGGN